MRDKSQIPAWAILIIALTIALIAVISIASLHQYADKSHQAEILLSRLKGQSYHLDALEWQFERRPDPKVLEEVQQVESQIAQTFDELMLLDPGEERLQQLRKAQLEFETNMDENFKLIAAGNLEKADILDKEKVDPSFNALSDLIANTSAIYSERVQQAQTVSGIGIMSILIAAGLIIGFLILKFQKIERKADLMAVEQKALHQSEEQYRHLVELSPEAISIQNEGKIAYINPAGAKLFGAANPEQLVGKKVTDFVHPDHRDIARERIRQVVKDGKVITPIEEKFICLDGTVLDLEIAAAPITYHDKPCGQVIFRDITERRKAEEKLRLFRNLIDQSNDAIFVDDPETGRILDVNDKACNSLGYSREELLRMHVFDIEITLPDHFSWKEHAQEIKKKGYLILEGRQRRKDGTILPVEVNVSYVSFGKNNYTLTVSRDISERKHMENALRESEDRYKTIFETTGTATVVLEEDNKISLANEEFEKLTGYSREEVEGKKSWIEFVVKEDLERVIKYHRECRVEPKQAPNKYEFRLINKNGSIRDVFLTIAMIPGTNKSIASLLDITEHKQSEEALKESEERYRDLVESSPDGIFVHNLSELVFVNMAGAKILGAASPEELIGKPISQIIHPDSWETAKKRLYMEEKGKAAPLIEEKFLRFDGTPVDVEVVTIPYTHDGNLEVHAVVRDITERKQAEEDLRKERDFSSSLIQGSPIFFVAIDASGKTLMMNKAMLSALGYTSDEVVGKDYLSNFVPEADREVLSGIFEKIVKSNESTDNENRVLTKDGRELLVDWYGRPVFKAKGDFDYFFGLGIDVTEQRLADAKIREQAALIDNAHDAIAVHDMEHHIIYWNKEAERLYGWTAEEATGKNASELLYKDKEDSPLHIEARKSVIERGEWSGEMQHVTKDGREITVESRWTLMHDNEGKPKSILVINTDITGKKKLEEQFLRAQRIESIGTLAGGIAHDINNVLAPIMLSLELLKEKFPDDESQKLIEILDRSAQRGASLIKQVQSFARGVEGKRIPLQTAHLISEIRQIAKETFPRSIEIRTEIQKDLWTISGDATQLHQVLMNLCVNARDAMPDGGILSISAKNIFIDENFAHINIEARVGRYIVIVVTDTGTGIPPKIIDRMFEPFFTTKEHGKGTGLGLSTALGIVKSHGGFITVYSEVGEGTAFKVYLPAITTTETQKMEEPYRELVTGHGELILVVDDEDQIRDITSSALKTHGYRVLTASNGLEAIALYEQNKEEIKLVLMDMMMPVMDGLEGIQELRKINPELKIIAASGLTERDKLTKAAGTMNAFLPKPYTTGKLLRNIQEVLSAK